MGAAAPLNQTRGRNTLTSMNNLAKVRRELGEL
jgi:hypothetical protein